MFVSSHGSRLSVYPLNEDGTLASRTADYVIGEPSLYGRRNSPGIVTRSEGSLIGATAYDSVHHRIFSADGAVVAWGANPRILIFDAHPDRMRNGPEALAVLGQPDFTTRALGAIGPNRLGSRGATVLDERHQRLFVTDGVNNRIMVWDVHPDRLTETPDAMAVIGQDDFTSKERRGGPAGFGSGPSSLFYDIATDRLFVTDSTNHRVLLFDVSPESIENGMRASLVIGQQDFGSNDPGIGPDRLNRPGSLRYDDANERLFVTDSGNQRILVFDAGEGDLESGASATHVLGQDDFFSAEPRSDRSKLTPGATILDVREQRLLVNEGTVLNRMLVFDVHPDRIENNPDALAVLFQEDLGPSQRKTSQVFENGARPFLDEATNTLYVASGYPGGNRVLLYDFSPENVRTGMPAFDVLGHYGPDGEPNFDARAAYGRINERYVYPRAVAIDSVDHRLFVNDQYNNRVLMFELDAENRIVDRGAKVILGQPDGHSGQLRDIAANTMQIPLALAYDAHNKHLFVGDGWNNRVLIFDAHPDRLGTFDDAIAVLGQPDFESDEPSLGPDRMNFGVAWGRGIQSTAPTPLALEVDSNHQRLFVSDGINHRVLAFDIRPGMVRTGASAIGVLGQSDLVSNVPTPRENARGITNLGTLGGRIVTGRAQVNNRGFDTPSGLAYDVNNDRLFVVDGNNSRVMVFDAAPDRWQDGMPATAILGQMDETSADELRLDTTQVTEDVGRRRFRMPSGIAYDAANDRLLVNDKGNDRVLFFDARPEALETGMAANGVIGQEDFVTRNPGNGEQEQLLDPREIAFDSKHQRLYTTDSFWGRLVVFDLPRAERSVEVPARAIMSYGTLDAWNGRDDLPGRDLRQTWRGQLEGASALGGILVYYNTRQELDTLAKRRGRLLIGETSIAAPLPRESTALYVDGRDGRVNTLSISNPDSRDAQVDLRLRTSDDILTARATVPGNGRLEADLDELFETSLGDVTGALTADASRPVASMILSRRPTTRRETLVLASTGLNGGDGTGPLVLPGLKVGGGYTSEIVLLNPDESAMQGEITFFDRDGEPLNLAAAQVQSVTYSLAPGESLSRRLTSPLGVADEGYVVIEPASGVTPAAMARLSLWKGPLLLSETEIPAQPKTPNAWIPVDTMASIIRHGEARMQFAFANSSRTPATIRLTLFDAMGKERERWEQILPAFAQREWSLGDLFNVSRHRGTVRFWSDVPLALSARRVTRNLRGDTVENEIGYIDSATLEERPLELPEISEGGGLATEIVLINPTQATAQALLTFANSAGEPKEIILR